MSSGLKTDCDDGKKIRESELSRKALHFPSRQLFQHLQDRQYGWSSPAVGHRHSRGYMVKQLPGLLREKEYQLGNINKIFASSFISEKQVLIGTKCNKLIVVNLQSGKMTQVPSLKSSSFSQRAECPCGIHAITVNPSRTLLATGAENTNDVAVYSLPTMDPVLVGENGHTDWIFDMAWLDDQFLVSGSRDNTMALWSIDNDNYVNKSFRGGTNYACTRPKATMLCRKAEKVRAMVYNKNREELVTLSLNAFLHLWDANMFLQKMSHRLVHLRENVCIGLCETHNLYGVGSQSHVALVDPRSLKQINHIVSKQRGCGVRSLNFKDDMITIGTGSGSVFFYDMRANRYLEQGCGHTLSLTLGKGWLRQDENYHDFFFNAEYPNAVYTHCLDPSGTGIFAAGGPLPAGLWGNYAGLWS